MDEITRQRLERTHRPDLFGDCPRCSELSVKLSTHVCDEIRRQTYLAALQPPYQPNEVVVKLLEERLLETLTRHQIVVTSGQLRDLALTVEPITRQAEG